MLAHVLEAPFKEILELDKLFAVEPPEDLDVVLWQLERRHLEAEGAGRVGEQEAKVDVCALVSSDRGRRDTHG